MTASTTELGHSFFWTNLIALLNDKYANDSITLEIMLRLVNERQQLYRQFARERESLHRANFITDTAYQTALESNNAHLQRIQETAFNLLDVFSSEKLACAESTASLHRLDILSQEFFQALHAEEPEIAIAALKAQAAALKNRANSELERSIVRDTELTVETAETRIALDPDANLEQLLRALHLGYASHPNWETIHATYR